MGIPMTDYGHCRICGRRKTKRGQLCKACDELKRVIDEQAPGWRWVYIDPPRPALEEKR